MTRALGKVIVAPIVALCVGVVVTLLIRDWSGDRWIAARNDMFADKALPYVSGVEQDVSLLLADLEELAGKAGALDSALFLDGAEAIREQDTIGWIASLHLLETIDDADDATAARAAGGFVLDAPEFMRQTSEGKTAYVMIHTSGLPGEFPPLDDWNLAGLPFGPASSSTEASVLRRPPPAPPGQVRDFPPAGPPPGSSPLHPIPGLDFIALPIYSSGLLVPDGIVIAAVSFERLLAMRLDPDLGQVRLAILQEPEPFGTTSTPLGPFGFDEPQMIEMAIGHGLSVGAFPGAEYYSDLVDVQKETLGVGMAVTLLIVLGLSVIGWNREKSRVLADRLESSNHRATHDELTGLPNRSGLMELLEAALTYALETDQLVAALFIDVDRFKLVNDKMGHTAGDQLLAKIGQHLKSIVGDQGRVARFGGDEFVVIYPSLATAQQGEALAQRVVQSFDTPLAFAKGEFVAAVSVGVSLGGREHVGDAESMIRDADAAMYKAKARGGGGAALFDHSLRAAALKRVETERSLRSALDDGEIEVYYQPIVSYAGRVLAVEALIRWDRPGQGIVEPENFLRVAEDTGLIIPLGEFVLRDAANRARVWNADRVGPPLRVAVNVAERQLLDPGFPEVVARVLSSSGTNPDLLSLEISEDVVVDRLDAGMGVLHQLRRQGVRLAVDNFGTGRAPLSRLKELCMVDSVKIDQSFVAGLESDAADRAIIAAVVEMMKTMGISLVAEGVETDGQRRWLHELGIDAFQGYLYQRPVPPEELDLEPPHLIVLTP